MRAVQGHSLTWVVLLQDCHVWDVTSTRAHVDMDGASAGWYCVGCEQYKDDGEMEADHVCPLHKKPCVLRKEDNFFFRLSRYQKQIEVRHCNLGRHGVVHTSGRSVCRHVAIRLNRASD